MPDPRIDDRREALERRGVTGDVLDRAVEAAEPARTQVRRGMHVNDAKAYKRQENRAIVEAASPVIAEAGYRAGRVEIRAELESRIADWKARAEEASRGEGIYNEGYCLQRQFECEDILSALTDSEGRE